MSLALKVSRGSGRSTPGVGDPGLFGFLGNVVNKVAGVVRNVPGPIGMAAGGLQKLTATRRAALVAANPMFGMPKPPGGTFPQLQIPTPGVVGAIQRFMPGGETGMEPAIGSPSGYHVNKTAYFLKDGTFIPEGSRWVKNRKRNPLNPRAASRAIGRIESLKRATSRFSRITIRKKACS